MSFWRCWLSIFVFECLTDVSVTTSTTSYNFYAESSEWMTTADPDEFEFPWDLSPTFRNLSGVEEFLDPGSSWVFTAPDLPSGELDASTFKNVVVISDIHGDKASFLKSLWIAFLDVERQYIDFGHFEAHLYPSNGKPLSANPSDTVLIQLGDVVDRGPDGLECLQLLEELPTAIGWRVVRLYGNHEIMAHRGKSGTYVHPRELETFASFFGAPDARTTQFSNGGFLWEKITASSLLMARISTGSTEVNSASALFVHAGIDLHWIDVALEAYGVAVGKSAVDVLNELTRDAMMNGNSATVPIESFESRMSPLWSRDLFELDQRYVCLHLLPRVLKYFNVARLIVGHVPQKDREVKAVCGSRLILTDAGMSQWMEGGGGNPTALIMKQAGGQLEQLKGIYVDASATVKTHLFFHTHLGAQERKPEIAIRAPLNFVAAPSSRRGMYRAKYAFEGFAVEMAGIPAYALMEYFRYARPVVSLGVPQIAYLGPAGDASDGFKFLAILDTSGPFLSEIDDMSARMRRQIYEILLALWHTGYVLSNAGNVLEQFLLDSVTGLVQFVGFAALAEESGVVSLERSLSCIATALSRVASGVAGERIYETRLIAEVFDGIHFDRDAILIHSSEEPSPLPSPATWSLPEVDVGTGDLVDANWTITGVRRFFHSDSMDVFRGVVTMAGSDDQNSTTVVRLQRYDARAVAAMLAETGTRRNGIPNVLVYTDRADGSIYFAFDIDPGSLVPLRDAVARNLVQNSFQIVGEILELIADVHELGILFHFTKEDMIELFFVDAVQQHAYLFDVSGVTMSARDESRALAEIQLAIQALRSVFPEVGVIDNAQPPLQTHSATLPDSADEVFPGSF